MGIAARLALVLFGDPSRALKRVAILVLVLVFALVALPLVLTGIFNQIFGGGVYSPSPTATQDIPADLMPIFLRASEQPNCNLGPEGWSVLAAINYVESDFGRDLSTSSAGAVGWMQFEPSTWAIYRTTPSGAPAPNGPPGWNDPTDAIYTAACYLSASGAPADWRSAVFAYNHAGWYVDEVLSRAASYRASFIPGGGGAGKYVNPFANANAQTTRIDMGVDFAGDGPIDAIGDADVTYAGPSSGWMNGNVVNYTLTNGPDAGKFVYVAEAVLPVVKTGDHVKAGQPVATFGHGFSSNSIEIGWAAAAGALSNGWVAPYTQTLGGGYIDGNSCTNTAAGIDFYHLLEALHVPPSHCGNVGPETGTHYP